MLRPRHHAGRETPLPAWESSGHEHGAAQAVGPDGPDGNVKSLKPSTFPDEAGVLVKIARGEELFAENAATAEVYKLLSGSVRLIKLITDGRRQICEFVMPGEYLGLANHDEHGFSAEAIEECTAMLYRRSAIETRIAADADFAADIRRRAARGLNNAYERMVFLCHRSATARVAWFLLNMSAQLPGGRESFRLPMTRSDIGDYLGMALETVSRAFSQLKRAGAIVERSANLIVIADRPGLQDFADNA